MLGKRLCSWMAERLRRVSEKCDEWAFALALRATADHLLEDEQEEWIEYLKEKHPVKGE